MLCRIFRIWLLSLALLPSLARAGSPANIVTSVSPANSIDAFSGALRDYLVHHLPTVLYESHPGWGHTKAVATGINWTGKGLSSHPHISHGERNDGTWRTMRVTAPNMAQSLTLSFHNIKQPEPGRSTFDVALAFDAHVDCEQQNWKSGVRLYSGSARARLRVNLLLACEATSRVEWHKGLLPEAVFRLRVVKANTGYERFVLEHVAGVGGAAAKLIGDAVREGIHKWQPALERNLLARANIAIEKAGDSREVRIGLGSLLNTKSNPPTTVDSGATFRRKG